MMFSWFRHRGASGRWPSGAGRDPKPRRAARLELVVLETRTVPATSVFVDANNNTGVADGTALNPYVSVQAAITAAPADAIIKVAQGAYAENVVIPDADLQLLGGFAGGTVAAYADGQPGDFSAADPIARVTRITGAIDAPVLFLQNVAAKTIVIDGFVISGGLHGIYVVADYLLYANVTISHNVIENNGPAALQDGGGTYDFFGGGIYSSNATITVTDNTIRNNNANRGGGLNVSSKSDFTITDNLIENNSGYDDHGGGVVLNQLPIDAAGNGTFARNIIRGNVASKAFNYGWGGGVLIGGNLAPASLKTVTLSNNIYTDNSAPSVGGAIFADNGARVILDHELIYKNSTTVGGGAIYVDGDGGGVGTSMTIKNCTIADNSSGVYVEEFSNVVVSNSIFWGNTDDFLKLDSSTIKVTYTDSQEIWPGTGNLQADPLFANPAQDDYHLQSTAGRFDPAAQGGVGGWVVDAVGSPAIDAGDPAAAFATEPAYNGGRINLGADGNRSQASKSVFTGTDTTTELGSSVNPSIFGSRVTFAATVRMAAPSTARLSGTVHFMDGATELGSAPLLVSSGVGRTRFSTSALIAGSHAITVVYDGNTKFGPSTSAARQQIVHRALTKTRLTLTPRTVVTGQTMKLIATVTAVRPGAGKPTGKITFKEGDIELGSANLEATPRGVKATLLLSNLSVGGHVITASYDGDPNFVASATLVPLTGTVRVASTKTTLTSSVPSANASQPITFTAVIGVLPPGMGIPTGTVTFMEGETVLGTGNVQVVAGKVVATFDIATLPVGRHRIKAVYGGDLRFKASTSATLGQQVT